MKYYINVLKKYAVFNGRARRKEYWMFILFNYIIVFILGIIQGILGMDVSSDKISLGDIYSIAVFIPTIAVGIRRMHDINKSGWWILVPIYNIVLFVMPGTVGKNDYGEDPIEAEKATVPVPANNSNPTA